MIQQDNKNNATQCNKNQVLNMFSEESSDSIMMLLQKRVGEQDFKSSRCG